MSYTTTLQVLDVYYWEVLVLSRQKPSLLLHCLPLAIYLLPKFTFSPIYLLPESQSFHPKFHSIFTHNEGNFQDNNGSNIDNATQPCNSTWPSLASTSRALLFSLAPPTTPPEKRHLHCRHPRRSSHRTAARPFSRPNSQQLLRTGRPPRSKKLPLPWKQ